MSKRIHRHFTQHWQMVMFCLMWYDVFAVIIAYGLGLWLRFDGKFQQVPPEYSHAYVRFIAFYALFCILVFWLLKLYQSIWQFASFVELKKVCIATVITGTFHTVVITLTCKRMPISYYVFGIVIQFLLVLGIRFSYRFVLLLRGKQAELPEGHSRGRVMLIGAGAAGQMILRDIKQAKETNNEVCCIIDDNPNKWGRYIDGIEIIGGREQIYEAVRKYNINKIYVAIPSSSPEEKREILNICKETGCELKNLPGIYQMVTGEVTVSNMRKVSVEDLLGREQIQVNMEEIFAYITGRTILVTGGGGSIGSELCRQIAEHEPERLIILDIYENNAYDIQQELMEKYPDLDLVVLIASVRDNRRMDQIFSTYHPDIVYHAAAHKHVPLMEENPGEAIKNNVFGTYKTARAAMNNGCKKFVLISTDKAVNPTNIMGASKRLCEMIIQSFDRMIREKKGPQGAETDFVAVRFGNVLGSNGSVIPLFQKQIAAGGPVTVTHPDIIRYFMTIPEAVSLVLQAGTYAKGGEIFVLDMGDPVKIDDLARNLIKLSGYKPDKDIKIEYIGLRPGEKLYEEKLMAEEALRATKNRLIYIGSPIPFDEELFLKQLDELMALSCKDISNDGIKREVKKMVSTYHPYTEEG